MARRRPTQIELTMFPFLGVLCGMIGVFVLFLIIIISTRAVGGTVAPPPPPAAPASQGGAGALSAEEFERLERQLTELATEVARRQQKAVELARLKLELETQLAAKLDEQQLAADEADGTVSNWVLGKPEEVEMVVDPDFQVPKQWIAVEVKAEGFVVHQGDKETHYELAQLENPNSPFKKFLVGVDGRRDKEYLLLLLHPSGATACRQLRKFLFDNFQHRVDLDALRYAIKTRIDVGVEPFSRDWLLYAKQRTSPEAAETR